MAFTPKILSWPFRHPDIVGCLLKEGLPRGAHGHPRTPPPLPNYAPETDKGKIDASGLYVLYASDFTSTLFFIRMFFPPGLNILIF